MRRCARSWAVLSSRGTIKCSASLTDNFAVCAWWQPAANGGPFRLVVGGGASRCRLDSVNDDRGIVLAGRMGRAARRAATIAMATAEPATAGRLTAVFTIPAATAARAAGSTAAPTAAISIAAAARSPPSPCCHRRRRRRPALRPAAAASGHHLLHCQGSYEHLVDFLKIVGHATAAQLHHTGPRFQTWGPWLHKY